MSYSAALSRQRIGLCPRSPNRLRAAALPQRPRVGSQRETHRSRGFPQNEEPPKTPPASPSSKCSARAVSAPLPYGSAPACLASLPLLTGYPTRSVCPDYSTPYRGNTLEHDGPPKWSLYRWHIAGPIEFRSGLRVTIQTLGWWPGRTGQPLSGGAASVAYWCQREPHAPFPGFPPLDKRGPR